MKRIFRQLSGDELIHARNLLKKDKKPEWAKADPWWNKHWQDARARGLPTKCPECKKQLIHKFIQGYKKGKIKPLVGVHSAQIFHCKPCGLFWSTSMLKLEACGYRCRYD